jgi:hypothetical protein
VAALAVLALAGLLAACGGDDGEEVVAGDGGSSTTVDPDTPVSSPADDGTTTPGGPQWRRIEPTPDLVNPIVATPDSIVADPDDPDAVLIRFYGGVEECYGARAEVVSSDADEVRIRLETGQQPDLPPDVACIEIAESQELKLDLGEPVAGRTLTPVTT